MGMIRTVLSNSISNVTLAVVRLAIVLVMAPLIVHALGDYDYGIWEIIMAVVGYMGVLDLGIKPAITRYVARYHAMGDAESLRKVYCTSLVFMGALGLLGMVVLASWAVLAPELLAQKSSESSRYVMLLLIVGSQLLITFPGYTLECMHEGLQRYTV